MNIKFTFILFFYFQILLVSAQSKLKSPSEFLPHRLGEQFTAHHQLVDYFEYVNAQRMDMTKIVYFGATYEDRPQMSMIISSKENMANLEEIRLNNLKRVGLIDGKPNNENPISIVYLGYSVHGNEAAGSESSMKVIYELLNPNNQNTQNWLKNTVVIIDPSQNPDGYSRYTHWYRDVSNRLPDVDRRTNEHLEPWPTGRVNHYLFDLNRDWAWLTQIETQNRIRFYKQWMPHVHPDIHEQGSDEPYYFAPAAEPFHKYITPFQRNFQTTIGKNHAKYFDQNGWLYFTKEVFDLFYPSYGDTYPTFNGAIGMTYEQGGIGAGRAIITEIGDTLTLADRIEHHFITSLSTIEVASKNARLLIDNFTQYFRSTSENPYGEYKTYVIKASNGRQKIKKLTEMLTIHKIKFGTAKNTKSSVGFEYLSGKETSFNIEKNDLLISAFQPLSTLTQVLFDPVATLSDSLTYDITAWAIPYAQGLEAFATKEKLSIEDNYTLDNYTIKEIQSTYAYLSSWKSVYDASFLSSLIKAGIRVRFATIPFEIEGKKYDYGTLIITKADNKRLGRFFDIHVKDIAKKMEQEITPVSTGFVDSGADFGSSKVIAIDAPRVLCISGEGVANNAFGHLWHYFENDINYPASILPIEKLKRFNLNDYNTLIFSDGTYELDEKMIDKIRTWIINGGKLILMEEALKSFEDQKGFALKKVEEGLSENKRLDSFVDLERKTISDLIPGAIFNYKMDNTHPLAFGFKQNYFSLKTNTLRYNLSKEGFSVGKLENKVECIGFSGHKSKSLLKNTMQIGTQNIGKGSVIYISDNPVFRGFWDQGKLLMSNALFIFGNY